MKFVQLLVLGEDKSGSLARTKDRFQCVGLNLNFADTFNAMPSPNQILPGVMQEPSWDCVPSLSSLSAIECSRSSSG